jgi:hypothetical protein
LIPHPLRTEWHGPDITHFASVCCDLARLYVSFFPLFGLVEAFDSAVRWDRKRLYRSRWGNYDLVLTDGLFTVSEGVVGPTCWRAVRKARMYGAAGSTTWSETDWAGFRLKRRWPSPAISKRVWYECIRLGTRSRHLAPAKPR